MKIFLALLCIVGAATVSSAQAITPQSPVAPAHPVQPQKPAYEIIPARRVMVPTPPPTNAQPVDANAIEHLQKSSEQGTTNGLLPNFPKEAPVHNPKKNPPEE